MQLADQICEISKKLSDLELIELFDFADFLQQRRSVPMGQRTTPPIVDDYDNKGRVMQVLELLASPRFAQRPKADGDEVVQRLAILRGDWDLGE